VNQNQEYDLEERLLNFASQIIELCDNPKSTFASQHIARQLIRSGTSPMANHGEAEASESTKNFIHKLSLSLKELRESNRWLKLLSRTSLPFNQSLVTQLLQESDQLIRIFVASIRTTKKRL
jgi:four helix bundle protein